MSSMEISSTQAKVLIDFINDEMSEYVEKKVKDVDLAQQGEAFRVYEETRTALVDVREQASQIIEYARLHSGTMSTPKHLEVPYTTKKSEISDPWQSQNT